jgi:hypothetical protein
VISSHVWTAEAIVAFDAVKQALCSSPALALPDWALSFISTTAWSRLAIGAVLSQENSEGEEHLLAFASHSLTAAEQNYAATEGECLAVNCAVD